MSTPVGVLVPGLPVGMPSHFRCNSAHRYRPSRALQSNKVTSPGRGTLPTHQSLPLWGIKCNRLKWHKTTK
jgi:hypothetical protein